MKKRLLIVFTRNPELGKVKTRLAKTIGDSAALKVYETLLRHTEITVRDLNCDKAIYYSIKVRDNDIWNSPNYQKFKQDGADLGERMSNAFLEGFDNNYEQIIIVGSDLYDLKPNHINDAFSALEKNDAVLGPAEDGGYYLLGMKTHHPKLFKNKSWGTASVFQNTIEDLKNVNVHLLEQLNDIDTYEDLIKNQELKQLLT